MTTDAGMVAMAFDLVRLRPKLGCVSVHFPLLGEFRLNRLVDEGPGFRFSGNAGRICAVPELPQRIRVQ
jgi:hypothetical protein